MNTISSEQKTINRRKIIMKKTILIAVIFTVMAGGGLFAQAIPGGFASPQSSATQGRLRSAADDFIRPDSYSGVAFTKWYGMASFASTTMATLGFAAKPGKSEKPVYIGAFYNGSFWANAQFFTSTERHIPWLDVEKRVSIYDSLPSYDRSPSNQVAVLIGVADMGFRLSYRTTHQIFKEDNFAVPDDPDNTTAYEYYKSYKTELGLISPQLAWSMAKNLTAKGIKPWATFDLTFNREYTKDAQYSPNNSGDWVATEYILISQNNVAPEFNIGLGNYTLVNKNNWRTSVDLEYRLQITAYNNDYNYTDENGDNKINSFKGTYNGSPGVLTEQSFNGHRIRPIISTQWNGEKLRLRAKLDFNMIFNSTENNPMAIKLDESNYPLYNGKLAYEGDTAKIFNFQFNPDLQLAAQWQVLPRLFLNVGGRINLQALSKTTTKGKTYMNDEAVENTDYTIKATAYGATLNQLNIGFTLNATDNLSIEAVTGVSGTTKTNNNVNVFETTATGLFNFGSILVALKF